MSLCKKLSEAWRKITMSSTEKDEASYPLEKYIHVEEDGTSVIDVDAYYRSDEGRKRLDDFIEATKDIPLDPR